MASLSTKRRRAWDSFYCGAPHDVIVLDDDDSASPQSRKRRLTAKRRRLEKARDVYVKRISSSDGAVADDDEGHYVFEPNQHFTRRYKIVQLLGQGTFGKVVQCVDLSCNKLVAIKVIRSVQKYRDASRIELRVLDTLRQHDPTNIHRCIHFIDCFDYRNHICIVTEMLGMSLFDFLKDNRFAPFPLRHIQHFAQQLFSSVAFLHSLSLIHTDLKPENILLVRNDSKRLPYRGRPNIAHRNVLDHTDIRLIDFGSATFSDEYHSSVVSTRHYRAPEIILGAGWSFPCDIWSIGCILLEFYTGDALFQTHDNLEHLAMMEMFAGRFDDNSLATASKNGQKFFRNGRVDYPTPETSRSSRKYVKGMKKLADIVPPTNEHSAHFYCLLKAIFAYDQSIRITAAEALRHPYHTVKIDESLDL